MKILITAATFNEVEPLINYCKSNFTENKDGFYEAYLYQYKIVITGIGCVATAFKLTEAIHQTQFDYIINVGIAGAYGDELSIGQVTEVVFERFGDLGAKDDKGNFLDIFDLNLIDENESPFFYKNLSNNGTHFKKNCAKVTGNTVNCVNGYLHDIISLIEKNPEVQVETMEGAAIFYICTLKNIQFQAFRSISNFVEPRNKLNWNIPLAISNLNEFLINEIIQNRESNEFYGTSTSF